VLIFTTIKEIPEFRCLVGRQACLLTNRAALHPPEADANGQRPRHFLRMQESLHSFVVSKRTSINYYAYKSLADKFLGIFIAKN